MNWVVSHLYGCILSVFINEIFIEQCRCPFDLSRFECYMNLHVNLVKK